MLTIYSIGNVLDGFHVYPFKLLGNTLGRTIREPDVNSYGNVCDWVESGMSVRPQADLGWA